ncbi:MAG: curli production assembly/transport component CsgG domain protein [Spirochaetes bacterium]|nr:curli production assembly/transport component CsgG domain protein [Spirochaetota bacterium]
MKTKILFLILLLGYCKSVDYKKKPGRLIDDIAISLKSDLIKNYDSKERISLAVAGFSRVDLVNATSKYKSVTPRLGVMIANALQNEMFIPEKFELIERLRIDALLSEVEFNQIGLAEGEAIKTLKLKGINSIVLGNIQLRDKSFRFDARIVELETGKVKSVASKIVDYYEFLELAYNDYSKGAKPCIASIAARGTWQNTSCVVKDVKKLNIQASGRWSMTDSGYSFGPMGIWDNPSGWGDYRLAEANHGALLCRIGGFLFAFDGQTKDVSGMEGVIECRINDTAVSNNDGTMTLTIETE